MRRASRRVVGALLSLAAMTSCARAAGLGFGGEDPRAAELAKVLDTQYRTETNIPYLTVGRWQGRLDLLVPRGGSGPRPTVVYFHGGGWVTGSKEEAALELFPYLQLGFLVVNVEYRLGDMGAPPAAVEDCRCALRWVSQNAARYGIDRGRVVLAGNSAGGHLALMTGMAPASAGFDRTCSGDGKDDLKVAAIVNFYGITDVGDVVAGANPRPWAQEWITPSMPGREALTRRISPLGYVRKDLPPILTIHGDADTVVPYQHAMRLHAELRKVGAPERLYTVRGGQHGNFGPAALVKIVRVIKEFVEERQILRAAP